NQDIHSFPTRRSSDLLEKTNTETQNKLSAQIETTKADLRKDFIGAPNVKIFGNSRIFFEKSFEILNSLQAYDEQFEKADFTNIRSEERRVGKECRLGW